MAYKHWTLDDIPWDAFDRTKVDPEIAKIIRAAALVEYNANDYATYLGNVFHDDPEFQQLAQAWAVEEVQHGTALGRWAELADSAFSLETAFARFRAGFRIPLEASQSVRGSRCGELIARCMVETGTSSYYSAIGDATDEPALKAICRKIATDEFRHYGLFYQYLKRYLEAEHLGRLQRLRVALERIAESEDDELAYAFYAGNAAADEAYDHARCHLGYMSRAYSFYRPKHVGKGVAMIFKACGLTPQTALYSIATRSACWFIARRSRRLARAVTAGRAVSGAA